MSAAQKFFEMTISRRSQSLDLVLQYRENPQRDDHTLPTTAMSLLGHVWTAPPRQVLIWRDDDCGRDAVMCLACWCSHCSRLLALMWFARWVLIKSMSTPVTHRRFSRLDDRPINIMPSAPPQPVTPYGVFLALALQSCAAAAAIAKPPIR